MNESRYIEMKKPFSKLFGLKDKELEHIEEARAEGCLLYTSRCV